MSRPLKIGIEASSLTNQFKTGVHFYTYNIIKHMAQQAPKTQFLLGYFSFITKQPLRLDYPAPNIRAHRMALIPGRVYNALFRYLKAPYFDLLTRVRADVFLFPNFFRWPLLFCRRSVLIIHDLSFLHYPEHTPARFVDFLRWSVKRGLAQADQIVAVSEATKQDIIKHYPIKAGRITVVTPAVDHTRFHPFATGEIKVVAECYNLPSQYVLFTGTLEPRKNIGGVLAAYQLLPADIKKSHPLVLAGGKGWLDEAIEAQIAQLAAAGSKIIRLGYVPADDLPLIYAGATVFVYPSYFEGFGMPVLEALACGVPVITSSNSSLPEAGGQAALYIDPAQPQQLTEAMVKVIASPSLRRQMVAKGLAHAQQFSWDKSAAIMLEVLEKAAATSGRRAPRP